jgi:hypothetical protein
MTTLPFHNVVSMAGWWDDDSTHTVNLGTAADASALTQADEGMAVTLDATGPNKYRPVTTGDHVDGYLLRVEARPGGNVGTIAFKFIERLFLLAADAATIGDPVVGSAGGTQGVNGPGRGGWVMKDVSSNAALNHTRVVEKGTDPITGFTYVVVVHV